MLNAAKWPWPAWRWRNGLWSGRLFIPYLIVLTFATSCASIPATPTYQPTIPPRPELQHKILSFEKDERTYTIVDLEDWRTIGAWVLALERELKAACLALGGTKAACRAE